MMDRAKLMVLVSHDLQAVARLCDRVVWLDQGRVRADGDPADLVNEYSRAADELQALEPAASVALPIALP
jgi:ABC-type polysaccharide/polyol phosphate transport system ATPase subunit